MKLNSLKSVFTSKDKSGGKTPQAQGGNAAPRKEKIAAVSPSRARLEKRANDEKIIKTIKIIFTTVVTVAVIGIILSIFLYVYKPTVATVGGAGIEQREFTYFLRISGMGASEYSTTETIAQQALSGAAEMKIKEVIAKERGLSIGQAEKAEIESQMTMIDQQAAQYGTSSTGATTTGDEYIRSNLGISKSDYKKIMETELLGRNLEDLEFENMSIPDEDALQVYDANIADYEQVTVRHILFLFEGKEDAETPRTSEESLQLALDTVDRINAGEDMAELVQELSEDTSLTNEGIYTFSRSDSYEQGFKDWAFDPERKTGDTGYCETSYGYHVMRLEGSQTIPFEDVKDQIIDDIKYERYDAMVESWKGESRFQVQTNQRVYDSMVQQILGGA